VSTSLTGSWEGLFDYFGEVAPVAFHAQLHEANGAFSGLIEETDDMLDGHGPIFLTGIVEGSRRGENVAFRKTYDELVPVCCVDYDGTVDLEATEICGEWVRLEDGLTGSFVMRRKDGREMVAKREAEIALDR
jgi:hypothetical protein